MGGSFPNYMLNKDKFAPGQNFEASGATSTAENTKGKNRTLRAFTGSNEQKRDQP